MLKHKSTYWQVYGLLTDLCIEIIKATNWQVYVLLTGLFIEIIKATN